MTTEAIEDITPGIERKAFEIGEARAMDIGGRVATVRLDRVEAVCGYRYFVAADATFRIQLNRGDPVDDEARIRQVTSISGSVVI